MSDDNSNEARQPSDTVVTVRIVFNVSTGDVLVEMPERGNALMLYGMLEHAKNEVRHRFIDRSPRAFSPIVHPRTGHPV